MSQSFALGDVLSITTGHLVSRDHMDGVCRILNYMTGDSLFTHQLPLAAQECKSALLTQHPQLRGIKPRFEGDVFGWLAKQEAIYGAALTVEPLILKQGNYSDPVGDIARIMGGGQVTL